MRIQCTACDHPADLDRLDAVTGGFGFACGSCGVVNVVAPAGHESPSEAEPAPSADTRVRRPPAAHLTDVTPPPGTVECPKCQYWQPTGQSACHRCGLMFAYAATGRARLPGDPLEGHPAEQTIRRRWQALAADLDDVEGHRAFIQMCAEADLLEYAGVCYRRLAARSADPRIAEHRQRVLEAAMARVGRIKQRVDVDTRRLRNLIVLLVAALIVCILAFGYYLLTKHQVSRQFEGRHAPASHHLANGAGPGHHAGMSSTAAIDRRGG